MCCSPGRELGEVGDVGVEVDLLDGPGVLDGVPVALVEVRVAHGAQGQFEARVEQVLRDGGLVITGRPRRTRGFPGSRRRRPASGPCCCWARDAAQGRARERARAWGGLRDAGRRAGAQVVRGLEAALPGIGVHRGELADGGRGQEQVQRLALVQVRGTGRGHVDQGALRAAPTPCGTARAPARASSSRPCTEPLASRSASRVRRVPQPEPLQLLDQVGVHLEELAAERLAFEEVGDLRLDALVHARDGGDGRGRGDGQQQRVAHAGGRDTGAQRRPAAGPARLGVR